MRLLLCVDYGPLRSALARGLVCIGFEVTAVADHDAACAAAKQASADLVAIAMLQPGAEASATARAIEEALPAASVLVLRCGCLNGIDDRSAQVMVRETIGAGLLTRIVAALGASHSKTPRQLRFGDLELRPGECRAMVNGVDVGVTPCEYRVLEHLALCQGEVVSTRDLLRDLSSDGAQPSSNVIAQWVSRVRTKVRVHGGGDPIETRRGLGYTFLPG